MGYCLVNRKGIDLRLTKHMHLTHNQSNQKTRDNRKGIHARKMDQPNDNTFTTAGELINSLVAPGGQKPNTINPDLVK